MNETSTNQKDESIQAALAAMKANRLIERLQEAPDAELEGIRICSELIQEISEIPGVSGVNLMTMGNPDSIPAAIERSGLRS